MDFMESKNTTGEFVSYVEYLKKIETFPFLTAKQEFTLAQRIKKGDLMAREKIINSNLFLSVSIAKRYYRPFYCFGLLDLIQEGNIGLIAAVDKYDEKRGCRFSTFATPLISQTVIIAIKDKSRIIRIPREHKLTKYIRKRKQLIIELRREPTPEEISKKMGISNEELEKIKAYQEGTLSLDSIIGHDGCTIVNSIEEKSLSERITNFLFQEEIQGLITTLLNEKEREIIKLRFGFNGDEPKSLEKIGVIFGVTRERIRQILEEIMNKLRNGIREQQPILERQL